MSITKRGKGWELRNSIWIIWTFVWFFNSIAFFWVGARAGHRPWTLFGFFYLILATMPIVIATELEATNNIMLVISLVAWLMSIIHAFFIREKYLLLREQLIDNKEPANEAFHSNVQGQHNEPLRSDVQEQASASNKTTSRKRRQPVSDSAFSSIQEEKETPKYVNKKKMPKTAELESRVIIEPIYGNEVAKNISTLIDLNTCTEKELSSLPGIGVAKAKKLMQHRQQNGGFVSFDDFVNAIALAPHFAVQIKKITTISDLKKSEQTPKKQRRIVDI